MVGCGCRVFVHGVALVHLAQPQHQAAVRQLAACRPRAGPGGSGMRRSKCAVGNLQLPHARGASRRKAARRTPRTTSAPRSLDRPGRAPAATPGIATTMTTSRSSSNTSTGGSHAARRSDASRRKNWRCMRSACSISSQACAHIHRRIRDQFGSTWVVDPLQRVAAEPSAPDCRATSRPFRNATSVGMLRMPKRAAMRRLGLGVELGEAHAGRELRGGLLVRAAPSSGTARTRAPRNRRPAARRRRPAVEIRLGQRERVAGKEPLLAVPHFGPSASRSRTTRLVVSQRGHTTSIVPGAEERFSSMLAAC